MKMIENKQINNKRIFKNAIFLYIRMIVIMAINFYMSRVVLEVLGVTNYGIYNLVGSVVVIFSFLKSSLSESVQRFLNFEMGKDRYDNLNTIFNTCLNSYVIFALIIFIIGELIWLLWGNKLNIPKMRFNAATFAYQLSLITFIISLLQIPYNATIIAYEKMNFFAEISILEATLKLGLTFLITYISLDKLKTFSFLMMINSIIILIAYAIYSNYHFKICRYHLIWHKKLFKKIISYTSWNMVGSVSGVLSESGVSLSFNLFCGVLLNAAIGLSNQVNNAIMGFVTGYQTAFKPQIVKLFSSNSIYEMKKLIFQSSRYSFFLFFLISIPLIENINTVLNIWLVYVPKYASLFCIFILIGSLIDATSGVFYTAIGATGKISHYQCSISIVFLTHFLITLLLLYLGTNFIIILISRIITRGFINFIIGLHFMKKQIGILPKDYVKTCLYPILKTSIIPITVSIIFVHAFPANDIYKLCLNVIVFEIIAIASICKWGLNINERRKIINKIKYCRI